MGWGKVLVLVLVMYIQFGKVSPCPPASVIPGLDKSVQFLGQVSTTLSERKEDSNGNILPITSSIAFFKGLSKLSSLAGGVIGIAGFILDQFQESEFSKIKKEFGKVNRGIADLKYQFDDLARLVEKEHAWTRMHPNLQLLDTVSTTLDRALNDADLDTRNEFKAMLLTYYKNGDLLNSLNGIYYDVIGNPFFKSAVDSLYDQTNGDWTAINIMSQYISGVLVQGHLAFTSACVMHKVDEESYEKEDARQKCLAISESYFKKKGPLYEKKFEEALSKCKKTNVYGNLMRDVEEIVRDAQDRDVTPNSIVGDSIEVLIRNKYFWLDASVIVYDDITGYVRHTLRCNLLKLRDYGRNWCVMLRYKPEYRDPFADKEERVYSDKNYFPTVVSHSQEFDNVEPSSNERSAEKAFDTISTQLNHMGIHTFRLAAVRYRRNTFFEDEKYNVYTTTTNKEQHLVTYYAYNEFPGFSMQPTQEFIVIFSFRWEDVSFAMECPSDYPYMFNFGQDCTKSQRTWFIPTYYPSDGYVKCPVKPCRTRTLGQMNQKQNPAVMIVATDESLSTEGSPNFIMHWCFEMTIMIVMKILRIVSCFFK